MSGPSVILYWWTVDYATSYDVYRNGSLYRTDMFLNSVVPAGGTLLRGIFGSLTGGQTYSYYVIAKNSAGTRQSNTINVTAPATPPGAFTLSNDAPVWDTSIPGPKVQLTWTASSNATSYDVYRDGSVYSTGVTQLSFLSSANLTRGQTYSYYVIAKNSTGTRQSNTIIVTIPPAGKLSLSAETFFVAEGVPTIAIPVNRSRGSYGEVTVTYTLVGGTAGNDDFIGAGGSVTFGNGVTSQIVTIPIVDDVIFEGLETFTISLSLIDPTGGATLSGITSATITITDNDVFLPRAAGYTGLLNYDFAGAGYGGLKFQRTAMQGVTGKLLVDGRAFSFVGRVSPSGGVTKSFSYKVGTVLVKPVLTLQIQSDDTFIGTWDKGNGITYRISGEENAAGTSTAPISSMGKYTALLRGEDITPTGGSVRGYLRATIAANGATTFVGALPDGKKLSRASHVSIRGNLPIVFGLYQAGAGYLFGPGAITGGGSARVLAGDLRWFKPPQTRGIYQAGVDRVSIELAGHVWTKPASGLRLVPDFDATGGDMLVTCSAGDLGTEISKVVNLTTKNPLTITPRTAEKLTLSVSPGTGFLTGTFRQLNGITRTFNGVFVQSHAGPSTIEGTFPGVSLPGLVTITIPPP